VQKRGKLPVILHTKDTEMGKPNNNQSVSYL